MSYPGEPIRVPASSGAERRRETRLDFSNRCLLGILGPAWALVPRPFSGHTENITANGLRINFDSVPRSTAVAWKEAVAQDLEIKVEVVLPELAELPPVKGTIAWVSIEPTENDSHEETPVSVGVLFSLMKEREAQALRKLVESLAN